MQSLRDLHFPRSHQPGKDRGVLTVQTCVWFVLSLRSLWKEPPALGSVPRTRDHWCPPGSMSRQLTWKCLPQTQTNPYLLPPFPDVHSKATLPLCSVTALPLGPLPALGPNHPALCALRCHRTTWVPLRPRGLWCSQREVVLSSLSPTGVRPLLPKRRPQPAMDSAS